MASVWQLRCHGAARRGSHLDRATAARITRTSEGRSALRARAHANDAADGDGVHLRGGSAAPRRRTCPGGRGSSSRPSPPPSPTRAAAAARVATVWVVGDAAPQGRGPPFACPPGRAKDARASKEGTARFSAKTRLAGGHVLASNSQTLRELPTTQAIAIGYSILEPSPRP